MVDVTRREVLTAGAVAAAAGVVGVGGVAGAANATGLQGDVAPSARRGAPNIIMILVDEMRFPMSMPNGVTSPKQFLRKYMPNLAKLWDRGVKFSSHYTSGTACSPARACLVTGLYPHQNWCLQTRKGHNPGAQGPNAPAMQRGFPTYGKLMRQAGYITPYVGKWHLSNSPTEMGQPGTHAYLDDYGFQGLTIPDPIGTNGQGTDEDPEIASQAAEWLQSRKNGQQPFMLTVSFVNPHDKEYFWAGTEANRYMNLYAAYGLTPAAAYDLVTPLNHPKDYNYPTIPDNWESEATIEKNKPKAQLFTRYFTDMMWGGVDDNPSNTSTFKIVDYPDVPGATMALAPFTYWRRASDSYNQVLGLVDKEIGRVIDSIPDEIADNTVIIMTADHGDYSSAHGFAANKAGSMYEEAINVPLIVVDPRDRLTGDTDVVREQFTESVDILPMLVTIAHGDREWMRGDLADMYGERLNLLPLLKSNSASGRSHIISASDEWVPQAFNFNDSARHIMGLRTEDMKVATYSNWSTGGFISSDGIQYESYDYSTTAGQRELDNQWGETARAQELIKQLLTVDNVGAMEKPLPKGKYSRAQAQGKREYLAYIALLDQQFPSRGELSKPGWINEWINPS